MKRLATPCKCFFAYKRKESISSYNSKAMYTFLTIKKASTNPANLKNAPSDRAFLYTGYDWLLACELISGGKEDRHKQSGLQLV
ncbi:hypothetical protein HMPREF0083_02153 [Aneurinibacillus aneurinilyticus ATCC 12856]|uniref:Uncharacterized protein n=1 Tax=Aneurinibacillus aneurinilyticus ATCC 12856 TaxID=649747 RepID=U1X5J0_ANEAE|nr:hypothetical protein HMPREF0083_02153 [Aneurinibacillus aneurinilyticus ATCC 12856]